MKDNFQIICVDDKFKSGDGIGYEIGLINIGYPNKFSKFGIEIDGENYREDCWRADIGIGDTDMFDMLSYVSFDGTVNEFERIDDEFRNEIIKTLNL